MIIQPEELQKLIDRVNESYELPDDFAKNHDIASIEDLAGLLTYTFCPDHIRYSLWKHHPNPTGEIALYQHKDALINLLEQQQEIGAHYFITITKMDEEKEGVAVQDIGHWEGTFLHKFISYPKHCIGAGIDLEDVINTALKERNHAE